MNPVTTVRLTYSSSCRQEDTEGGRGEEETSTVQELDLLGELWNRLCNHADHIFLIAKEGAGREVEEVVHRALWWTISRCGCGKGRGGWVRKQWELGKRRYDEHSHLLHIYIQDITLTSIEYVHLCDHLFVAFSNSILMPSLRVAEGTLYACQ